MHINREGGQVREERNKLTEDRQGTRQKDGRQEDALLQKSKLHLT